MKPHQYSQNVVYSFLRDNRNYAGCVQKISKPSFMSSVDNQKGVNNIVQLRTSWALSMYKSI